MFVSRRPLWGQRSERFNSVQRAPSTVQRSVAFIAAMLTLSVLLSIGSAQASQPDNSRTTLADQHAAEVFAKPSAAMDPVAKFAIKNVSDRSLGAAFYDGCFCSSTSCPGSSAVIFV